MIYPITRCLPTFKRVPIFVFLCICIHILNAQTLREVAVVKPFHFIAPLDGKLYVSGTFGEPRPNHYHAGLDLKTNGQINWSVKAAEEGFVSRIKVSATGYGNALYVTHPFGLTTVYGHLNKFIPAIEQWVKKVQYERQSFEIDTILTEKIFEFKKGEIIAYSGNTGGSAGPHLHFEVRETYSELVVNPMRFGFDILDNIPPILSSLKVYSFENSIYEQVGSKMPLKKINNQNWSAETIRVPEGKVTFSVQAFDRQNLTPENKNGIPELKMYVDGQLVFHRKLDTIDFSLTRYTHAMIDYSEKVKTGKDFYIFAKLPGNAESSPYLSSPSNGEIEIKKGESKTIELQLIDFNNNVSKLKFKMEGMDKLNPSVPYLNPNLLGGKKVLDGAELRWSDLSFYDLLPDKIDVSDAGDGDYSKKYNLFTEELYPFHRDVELAISEWNVPNSLLGKIVLVSENYKHKKKALTCTVKDNIISALIPEPGLVSVDVDTVAPKVQLVNFKNSTRTFSASKIRVKITDDLSGINSYNGFIDDKWVLFEYDAKNDMLTYEFDQLNKGTHDLKILVSDRKNNLSESNVTFIN